jgi:hypothetical protein
MVLEEIKQFVISQMKESDWESDHSRELQKYVSKYLDIRIPSVGKNSFTINVPTGYSSRDLVITRKELGLNLFHFWYLMRYVKKSCKNVEKRRRDREISNQWNRFLEKNKDLKRDTKLNKILD